MSKNSSLSVRIISYYTYFVGWFGLFICFYLLINPNYNILNLMFNWILFAEYFLVSLLGIVGATLFIDRKPIGRMILIVSNCYIVLMAGLLVSFDIQAIIRRTVSPAETLNLFSSYWAESAIISLLILLFLNKPRLKEEFLK